jgi:hypothetical protein
MVFATQYGYMKYIQSMQHEQWSRYSDFSISLPTGLESLASPRKAIVSMTSVTHYTPASYALCCSNTLFTHDKYTIYEHDA